MPDFRYPAMTLSGFLFRLFLAVLMSVVMLVLLSVAAFCLGWYFFGLIGHPAGPDVPPGTYLAYGIVAPLLCVGLSVWLVFRRSARHNRP
jgi:hypothetical protein